MSRRLGMGVLFSLFLIMSFPIATHASTFAVTSVAPSSGAAGTHVIITGTGLSVVKNISFGQYPAGAFTLDSDTQIEVNAPPGLGTVDVMVADGYSWSAAVPGDLFTYPPASAPVVTNVSPSGGPSTGGGQVTINGNGFLGATAVHFGPQLVTRYNVLGDTQIMVNAPAGSGTVDVTVTTPSGTSSLNSADKFSYLSPPNVNTFAPSQGPKAGGTPLTINGSNFLNATGVSLCSNYYCLTANNVVVKNDTLITVLTPAWVTPSYWQPSWGTDAGVFNVVVGNLGGQGWSSGTFTYTVNPVATHLTISPVNSLAVVGGSDTLVATATDSSGNPAPGVTVVFAETGANSISGSSVTNAAGQAQFTFNGAKGGFDTVVAFADNNSSGVQDSTEPSANATILWYENFMHKGYFVIGDKEAGVGKTVTFWGSNWSTVNSLSSGSGPASFKGFANSATLSCPAGPSNQSSFTASPGASFYPSALLSPYMAVLVTSSVNKNGSVITGNVVHVAIVKTANGDSRGDRQKGATTGTVVAMGC